MKRYHLTCFKCGEEESMTTKLHDPGELYCVECDSEITAEEITGMINGWADWLKDYNEMLEQEKKNEV